MNDVTGNTSDTRVEAVILTSRISKQHIGCWTLVGETVGVRQSLQVFTGSCAGKPNEAIIAALEKMLQTYPNQQITIYTVDPRIQKAAEFLTEHRKGLRVHRYDEEYPHPLHTTAVLSIAEEIKSNTVCAPAPPRVTVAVDGSFSRHTHTAGMGVIFEDGRSSATAFKNSPAVLFAEVKAIETAIFMAGKHERLLIRCDSRPAIHAITESQHVSRLMGPTAAVVQNIRNQLVYRDVVFEWVKGHAGDPLNEGADRLAVAARRNCDSGTDSTVAQQMVSTITRETLEVYRNADSDADMHVKVPA